MRGSWIFLAAALACAVVTGGCGRATATTEVGTDGVWKRTVAFHGPAPASSPGAAGPGQARMSMSAGPKLEDIIFMPSAAPWTIKKERKENDFIHTATRTLRANETVRQDVVVRGKIKGNPGRVLVNEVTVCEVSPGRIEYREVLHWQGDAPDDRIGAQGEMITAIRNALPTNLVAAANAQDIAQILQRELWGMLFGPGDALISQMLLHPEMAERKIRRRAGIVVEKALAEKFGDTMTAAQRQATARSLVTAMINASDITGKAKTMTDKAPQEEGGSDGSLIPLTFVVKLPGKVVATNGEVDEISGEVYWTLYSEAAAIGDVVLTAVCEVEKR